MLRSFWGITASGVEWLGEVPAHWAIARLKRACSLIKDGTHLPPPRVEQGIPLLSVRNVEDGRFDFRDDDSMISEADYDALARSFVPRPQDVLLAIVGATIGKTAIVPDGFDRFHIQRSLAVFRTAPTCSKNGCTTCLTLLGSRIFFGSMLDIQRNPEYISVLWLKFVSRSHQRTSNCG